MRKFRIVSTGEEINEGDYFLDVIKSYDGNSHYETTASAGKLTDESIKEFLEEGLIEEIKEEEPDVKLKYLNKVLDQMATLPGISKTEVVEAFDTLVKINTWYPLEIFMYGMADIYNDKHDDDLDDYKELYAISPFNGKIIKVKQSKIKNPYVYPLFRTYDEAKKVQNLIKEDLQELFGEDEN